MRVVAGRYSLRRWASGVALAALLVTPGAHAFRTAQDSPDFEGAGRVAWQDPAPIFYLSRHGLPAGVEQSDVEVALQSALETWSQPECTVVAPTFGGWIDEAGSATDSINTVHWLSNWAENGFPADAPGTTDIQYRRVDDTWSIAEADIYLNDERFVWSGEEREPALLEGTLIHEMGHALGLLHPCEPDGADAAPVCGQGGAVEAETTMFPFFSPEQISLAPDDRDGICFLYPECGGCEPGYLCVEGECRANCEQGLCETGLVCGYWGCALPDACLDRDCTGASCESDRQCAPLGECRDGVCRRGGAQWGDACSATPDCSDGGVCINGRCEPECHADNDCEGGSCVASASPPVLGCVNSSLYEFGQHCERGDDCASGLCIVEDERSICTEMCARDADCPGDAWCAQIDGARVCLPDQERTEGGCALSPEKPEHSHQGWLMTLLLVAAAARRRLGNKQ